MRFFFRRSLGEATTPSEACIFCCSSTAKPRSCLVYPKNPFFNYSKGELMPRALFLTAHKGKDSENAFAWHVTRFLASSLPPCLPLSLCVSFRSASDTEQ